MNKYIENGARLGFLIQPDLKRVVVYRRGSPVEELKEVNEVSADLVLPGFTLDLREVWERNP